MEISGVLIGEAVQQHHAQSRHVSTGVIEIAAAFYRFSETCPILTSYPLGLNFALVFAKVAMQRVAGFLWRRPWRI